jgi:hypothetical protein
MSQYDSIALCNHSFSGGGWTHVVLSEPLDGDFQEGILIGRMELQARSEASSVWGINVERERHRVSPKTTPIRPPFICHRLLKGYRVVTALFDRKRSM